MNYNKNQYCVIMAGGVGSRFWPFSTQKFPKQFQDILGTGQTMLQQTFERIRKVIAPENIFVITNKDFIEITESQLPDIPKSNIVGEPMMKNTGACNLYMASKIHALNPEATMVVLPADHLILKEDAFVEKMQLALNIASKNDYLITLGITPTRPDTGYGYIQFEKEENQNVFKVKNFTEKPDLEFAKAFLESGDFLWNAGMFIWNTKTILHAFQTHLPEMIEQFSACEYNNDGEKECIEIIYPKVTKISVDNGILEKAENVFVIPADLGWSDLGTWTSVYENAEKNTENNTLNTKYGLIYQSEGNIIRLQNEKKAIVVSGLQDYIVVDTDNALLICPRNEDQRIKEFVQDLKGIRNGNHFL